MKQLIIQIVITICIAVLACSCAANEPASPNRPIPSYPVVRPKKTITIRRPKSERPVPTPRPLSATTAEGQQEEQYEEITMSEEEFEQFLMSNTDYFYIVE